MELNKRESELIYMALCTLKANCISMKLKEAKKEIPDSIILEYHTTLNAEIDTLMKKI